MFSAENIGRRISAARRAAGMTQMTLADGMGLSFQAVSNWERGVSMPDIGNLRELAALLGTTVDELLADGEAFDSPPDDGASADSVSPPPERAFTEPPHAPGQTALTAEDIAEPVKEQPETKRPDAADTYTPSDDREPEDADALAEKLFESGNVGMFAMVEGDASPECRKRLYRRSIAEGKTAFFAVMYSRGREPGDIDALAEKSFESGNVGMFAIVEGDLSPECRKRLYRRSIAEGKIAFLSLLRP